MKHLPLRSAGYEYVLQSFGQWLDILGYASTTVRGMPLLVRELLNHLEQKGKTQVGQITSGLIRDYYEELKVRPNERRGGALSSGYLNKHLQALYKFCEYLRLSGRLLLPDLNIRWEEDSVEEMTYLTVEEMRGLYEATYGWNLGTFLEPCNSRDRAILTIYYGCGLRRSEGYHLNVSDIDLDTKVLKVRRGKGYKKRLVPFNTASGKYLERYIYDWRARLLKDTKEPALFISQRGRRMESQSMALRLKILQDRCTVSSIKNKNVTLHILRHSIATHLLQAGMKLEKIAQFLGHSSLESTQIYTHLNER